MKTSSARAMTSITTNLQRFAEFYRGRDDSRLPYAIAAAWIVGGLVLGKVAEVTGFTDIVVDSFSSGVDFVGQQVDAAVDTAAGAIYDVVVDNGPQTGEYPSGPELVPNPDTLSEPRIPLLDSVQLG